MKKRNALACARAFRRETDDLETPATTIAIGNVVAARATTGAIFARTRFVHGERTTLVILPMEQADRLLGIGIVLHRNEGKATGFAREFVLDQRRFADGARLGKKILKFVFGSVEGEVPDVKFTGHVVVFS
jgi:hypothetical protein